MSYTPAKCVITMNWILAWKNSLLSVATINRKIHFPFSVTETSQFAAVYLDILFKFYTLEYNGLSLNEYNQFEMKPFKLNCKCKWIYLFVTRVLCSMITSEFYLLAIVRFIILRHSKMEIANDFSDCKAYFVCLPHIKYYLFNSIPFSFFDLKFNIFIGLELSVFPLLKSFVDWHITSLDNENEVFTSSFAK